MPDSPVDYQLVLGQKQLEYALRLGLAQLGFRVTDDKKVTWNKKPFSAVVWVLGGQKFPRPQTSTSTPNINNPAAPVVDQIDTSGMTPEEIEFAKVIPRTVTASNLPPSVPTNISPQREMSAEEVQDIIEAAHRRGGL